MNKHGQWCNNCYFKKLKGQNCNECNLIPNRFVDKRNLDKKGNMKEVQDFKVTGHVVMIGPQIVVVVDEGTFKRVLETGYVSQHEQMDEEEHAYVDDGSICLIWKKEKKSVQPSRDEMIRSNEEGFTRADLDR